MALSEVWIKEETVFENFQSLLVVFELQPADSK